MKAEPPLTMDTQQPTTPAATRDDQQRLAPAGLLGHVRKHGLQIEWCRDIPEGARKLAVNRTREMLIHYGRNITSLNIETLVLSCYLQGINDCFEYHEHKSKTVGN
jgi:hypothetical protein